jgi:hypothetical protein
VNEERSKEECWEARVVGTAVMGSKALDQHVGCVLVTECVSMPVILIATDAERMSRFCGNAEESSGGELPWFIGWHGAPFKYRYFKVLKCGRN